MPSACSLAALSHDLRTEKVEHDDPKIILSQELEGEEVPDRRMTAKPRTRCGRREPDPCRRGNNRGEVNFPERRVEAQDLPPLPPLRTLRWPTRR